MDTHRRALVGNLGKGLAKRTLIRSNKLINDDEIYHKWSRRLIFRVNYTVEGSNTAQSDEENNTLHTSNKGKA